MNAQEILARRNAEVEANNATKRAFLLANPDLNACLMELKRAGFEIDPTRFEYAIHGPMHDRRVWVQAVESHTGKGDAPKSRKGRR